jgi:DNA-binding MarR family transcriptional regulator
VKQTILMPTVEREISDAEYAAAATLRAALRRFEKESTQILRGHGLTAERYELLLAIRARTQDDRQPTTADISDDLQLAHSSTTQLARRADDAGLLSRRVSTRDARVRYLALTHAGAAKLAAAASELGPSVSVSSPCFARSELASLQSALRTCRRVAEEASSAKRLSFRGA